MIGDGMGEAVSSCVMARSRAPGRREDRRGPVGRPDAFWSRTGCEDVTRTAPSAPVGPAGAPVRWDGHAHGRIRRRPGGVGGGPAPHVRDHLPPRRRQDHPHREVPALRRRAHRRGRGGEGARGGGARPPRTGWSSSSSAASRSPRPCCSSRTATASSTCSTRPGHRDFSEDTYRVLAAADAAVMVLDAAKGIEPQTLKLFEVCRARGLPLLTFINKWDRPGPRAARAARRDRGADRRHARRRSPGRSASPATSAASIDRRTRRLRPLHPHRPRRHRGARGDRRRRAGRRPRRARPGRTAADELDLLDGVGADLRRGAVPRRRADADVLRLGAHQLRRAAAARRASSTWPRRPRPRPDDDGQAPAARRAVLGLRVQGAGQHGPVAPRPHRLPAGVLGPLRAGHGRHPRRRPASRSPPSTPTRCSGRSARRSRRPAPATSSAWSTPPTCGSATRSTSTSPSTFPRIPSFAPEHFSVARVRDTGRFKQFRKGIAQLDEEGVVQVLRDPDLGDQAPMLAAVGPMQFEVAVHRLENEFGAPVELSPTGYTVARRTDAASAAALRAMRGVDVLARADGTHARAVREPVLARPARRRAARAHPRAAGRRASCGLARIRRGQRVPSSGGVEVDEVGAPPRRRCSRSP